MRTSSHLSIAFPLHSSYPSTAATPMIHSCAIVPIGLTPNFIAKCTLLVPASFPGAPSDEAVEEAERSPCRQRECDLYVRRRREPNSERRQPERKRVRPLRVADSEEEEGRKR